MQVVYIFTFLTKIQVKHSLINIDVVHLQETWNHVIYEPYPEKVTCLRVRPREDQTGYIEAWTQKK